MGNREFFCHLTPGAGGEVTALIETALAAAPAREV
jgi:hypothetical protein